MAGERTIRIKFDGTVAGLARAAKAAEREIDGVEKGIAGKAGAFARIGAKLGLDFTDGIAGAFKGMPPQVQAAVVAFAATVAVTLSAAIGAAITAGILLAVGGGVLAAGIKSAADSPQVQAAWKRFGDRGKKVFGDFGKPFEGPVSRALGTFGDTIERIAPTLKRMGESMAPIIDKLAPALAKMAENSMPGIEKALEAGKPLWDTLAEHLPDIGDAIDSFFSSIADGGPGANKFLGDFLTWLEGIIIILGKVIGWLATLYGMAREVWIGIGTVFADGVRVILAVIGTIITGAAKAFGWIPGLGPKLQTAATEFDKFQQKANAALDKLKDKVVRVTVEEHFKMFGKPGTVIGGIGGSGFKGLATGGTAIGGRTYLVGENGPELFTPGVTGTVTPNHALAGGNTFNINLRAYSDRFSLSQVMGDLAAHGVH